MPCLARPVTHGLAIIVGVVLTLAIALPPDASAKHKRPKQRLGAASFVAGFVPPEGTPPLARFDCVWVDQPLHDYECTPPPAVGWPERFPLAHALARGGNVPPDPAPGRWWGGLASPEIVDKFSCNWDGTAVDYGSPSPGEQLAAHYVCSYTNPQLHTFTINQIVSVCENETFVVSDCVQPEPPDPPPDPPPFPWRQNDDLIDPWYLPDLLPPDTAVTAGPPAVGPGEAEFEFTSSENGSSFECRFDGAAWEECEPPQAYTELADGFHSFEVRATDGAFNLDVSPAGRTWLVDATAPDTTILRGPRGTTRDRTPSFAFVASEPAATFECSLDDRPSTLCEPSHTVLSRLADGGHTFSVSARDLVGNVDESPALRSFILDTAGPRVQISGRRLHLTRRGRVGVRLRCPSSELSGVCAGKLSLKTARAVGRRPVTLGTGNFRLDRGRSGVVALKLSRRVRSRVVELQSLRVLATVRARDRVGNVATTSKRLLLAPRR